MTAPAAPTIKNKTLYWRVGDDVHAALAQIAEAAGTHITRVVDEILREHLGLPHPEPVRVADLVTRFRDRDDRDQVA